LLGSSGFPRLNIGTRTATAHAVENIPNCRIPLMTKIYENDERNKLLPILITINFISRTS
jgi:hypothetical protein